MARLARATIAAAARESADAVAVTAALQFSNAIHWRSNRVWVKLLLTIVGMVQPENAQLLLRNRVVYSIISTPLAASWLHTQFL